MWRQTARQIEAVNHRLDAVNHRLDEIAAIVSERIKPQKIKYESILLRLADHERISYVSVLERGEATATDVSIDTGRKRAVESYYLNCLVRRGFMNKHRNSRTVYFSIP